MDDTESRLSHEIGRLTGELHRLRQERDELLDIARTMSSERDINVLLDTILSKCRMVTRADAGSIYVVEHADSQELLRFKTAQNDSVTFEAGEFTIPLDSNSIAGAAAVMNITINIEDVRDIPEDAAYNFDASWDKKMGYSTRSVIAAPLRNREGYVIGVVQLLNRKTLSRVPLTRAGDFNKYVKPFRKKDEELLELVASQAGISLHTAMLYDEIQNIFDGFIKASVYAIEQRDPVTRGHSQRVAVLTRTLAETVDRADSGHWAPQKFSRDEMELIYTASLLHDFGKVWVPEAVLQKGKKLYSKDLALIRARFDFISKSIESEHNARKVSLIKQGASDEDLAAADGALADSIEQLNEYWREINAANEPVVLQAQGFQKIEEIAKNTYRDFVGRDLPFLSGEEVKSLLVARGSLTPEELEQIRAHAKYTRDFLSMIPWGSKYARVPSIAGSHHEALNGSGYPDGLKEDEIPVESKMMMIADIFDALTASDRPYKRAVPLERALEILKLEVRDGRMDENLLGMFIENRVYDSISHMKTS